MNKAASAFFYSGISGLQLPYPKYLFPPPFENASRLTYYASLFNSIEINSSFYKIPLASTVSKWAASVPENFRFTFKLWKEITHNKNAPLKEEDVAAFLRAIHPAREKQGCLLIQFPPGTGVENIDRLNQLLACIRAAEESRLRLAVEFRNKSWYNEKTYELLQHFGAALVIQDIPKSATPMIDHASGFIYVRFHGPTGNYRDSYTEDFLNEFAAYISEWMEDGKEVYTYFNNTMGDAFNNLNTLNRLLHHKMSMA